MSRQSGSEVIKAVGLTHRYDATREDLALDQVGLTVREGEFVAVLGHNGSGKSTLAKHVNALLLPTGGTVWVGGWDTREQRFLWDIRRTAGMVFQNPDNQLIATTVEEDVAFGPENLGIPPAEIRRRVDEALAAVGMADFAQRAPHLLSGGQKQRVAIAGILAMRPRVIVLDEPTAMLDPSGRREVMQTVQRLNREEGITILHITHHMDEAVLADRVLVMEAGRLVLSGTPREVFSRVEEVKALGLDVPQITELAAQLHAMGLPVPKDVLTVDEMVTALCPSSSTT